MLVLPSLWKTSSTCQTLFYEWLSSTHTSTRQKPAPTDQPVCRFAGDKNWCEFSVVKGNSRVLHLLCHRVYSMNVLSLCVLFRTGKCAGSKTDPCVTLSVQRDSHTLTQWEKPHFYRNLNAFMHQLCIYIEFNSNVFIFNHITHKFLVIMSCIWCVCHWRLSHTHTHKHTCADTLRACKHIYSEIAGRWVTQRPPSPWWKHISVPGSLPCSL